MLTGLGQVNSGIFLENLKKETRIDLQLLAAFFKIIS